VSISLTTAFPWIIDKIIYPLLSWALPKAADGLMSSWFDRHLFIDDVITSIDDKTVIFDIRVSNASDQALSLTKLYIKIFNPPIKGVFYTRDFQNHSATYEVFDKDGKLITNVGNEEFFDFSFVVSSGNFIFQSKLLQKVNPKDTDRFKFVIHVASMKVTDLKHIETQVTYALEGKDKVASITKNI
jgi:hypothetical protein